MEVTNSFSLPIPIPVNDGGTGLSSLSPYAVLVGGATATGNVQQVSGVGTSGQVLTSNGASALPTWQTPSSGGVTSLNSLNGAITLAAGSNITLTPVGNTITIASTGGGGANTALSNLASVAINAALVLGTSDAFALGSTTKMWSDLYLASGGVINWNNGDTTLTHSSGLLTNSGSLSILGSIGRGTNAIDVATTYSVPAVFQSNADKTTDGGTGNNIAFFGSNEVASSNPIGLAIKHFYVSTVKSVGILTTEIGVSGGVLLLNTDEPGGLLGNIGVGTFNPQYAFDVAGTINTPGTTGNTYRWGDDSGTPMDTSTPVAWLLVNTPLGDGYIPFYQ